MLRKKEYGIGKRIRKEMEIRMLSCSFSVCTVEDYSQVDFASDFCFTAKTDEENSLVCRTQDVPDNVTAREDGWRAFRIQGKLDFSLIGILARISSLMADNGIGIFAISTYRTDYVLTKRDDYDKAIEVLRNAGYEISGEQQQAYC